MFRKTFIIASFVTIIAIGWGFEAFAQSARCDGVNPIRITEQIYNATRPGNIIQQYLNCYRNYLDSQQAKYYLEFNISVSANFDFLPLTLQQNTTDPNDRRDIVIRGLNIQGPTNSVAPVLTINGTQHKVILENSTIIDQSSGNSLGSGIRLQGRLHELRNVVVRGSASSNQARIGVQVQASGVLLSNVEVTGFGTGVKVAANDMKLKDRSHIHLNQIGVRISPDVYGTDIERTRIYGSDDTLSSTPAWTDAVRLENQTYQMEYLVENNGQLTSMTVDPQDGVVFQGGRAVVSVPEPQRPSLQLPPSSPGVQSGGIGPGSSSPPLPQPPTQSTLPASVMRKVDFFLTDAADCGLAIQERLSRQACGIIENVNLPMMGQLNGMIEFQIPAEHIGKRLIAAISDPNVGTLGLTAPMAILDGGTVLVTGPNPIFIPTQPLGATGGGGVDGDTITLADAAGATNNADCVGCDTILIEQALERAAEEQKNGSSASGGLVASAGGGSSAPKCSLDPNANLRSATIWTGLWWIITTLGILILARPICARVRHRSQRKYPRRSF